MFRIFVIAVLLLPTPLLAKTGCGWGHADQQAMSCLDGMVWDAQSQQCIKVTG